MTNTTQINNLYPVANATTSSNPFVDVFSTRDPTSNDVQYPIQKKWLNTTNNNYWILEGFSSVGGVVVANWVRLGGGAVMESVTVDTSTPPGTNPVIPNSGNIIVTGGQVAAGTTANVIQTDSLAASTYTIQVQRSQAVASSTIGDNGVCHFNSADFSVDANGFVSTAGNIATLYTENTGTATPSAGNLNVLGVNNITTTGSGSTIDISVTGTTTHAVQIGNSTGSLTSIAVGSTNSVLTGVTGADPVFSTTSTSYFNGISFNTGTDVLSIYHTGTFTPVLNFGGASVGITYNLQFGRFTQIGNLVFIYIQLSLTSKGSSTGVAQITGLPVTVATSVDQGTLLQTQNVTFDSGFTYGIARINNGTTTADLFESGSGVLNQQLANTNFENTSAVSIVTSYFSS